MINLVNDRLCFLPIHALDPSVHFLAIGPLMRINFINGAFKGIFIPISAIKRKGERCQIGQNDFLFIAIFNDLFHDPIDSTLAAILWIRSHKTDPCHWIGRSMKIHIKNSCHDLAR